MPEPAALVAEHFSVLRGCLPVQVGALAVLYINNQWVRT